MPIGKRVCESPPVPTVSGSSRRFSQLWMTAVAGAQRHAAAGGDEFGQVLVHLHVGRLRIGRGVTEGLHEHRRLELQAGEFGQLIGVHRPGGILGTDGGHLGSQAVPGSPFHAAGGANHLLASV